MKKTNSSQQFLSGEFESWVDFNGAYLSSHLITYIGNKRKLLPFINSGIEEVKKRLGKKKLNVLDGFSGSGVVARLLKYHASTLYVNDLEGYSYTINKSYLANRSSVDVQGVKDAIDFLNANKLLPTKSHYFITENYAPKNDKAIKPGERVFYTNSNARIIDNIRYLIDTEAVNSDAKVHCLANLLIKASISTNTSGVFKGFHKKDGIGHFGGRGENALTRILREIELEAPLFSEAECAVDLFQEDINSLVNSLPEMDLVYYDPPYNQHPYGSNYFMLNLINDGKPADIQNGVSGIAKVWNKSAYNKRNEASVFMSDLIEHTRAKYILISYNNEGIIPLKRFQEILEKYGKWELFEQEYNTYRGSRNLSGRDIKVKEMLWLLEKR